MNIKKYLIGLALTGAIASAIYMHKYSTKIIPTFTWPNDKNPESITIYNPNDKRIVYVDKKPFNSLDCVIDYTSGERIQRNPTNDDIEKFSKLREEAIKKGLLLDKY